MSRPFQGGASGGEVVDFNAVASRAMEGAVEPKLCELCGRQFFRPSMALYPVKYCAACSRKLIAQGA